MHLHIFKERVTGSVFFQFISIELNSIEKDLRNHHFYNCYDYNNMGRAIKKC